MEHGYSVIMLIFAVMILLYAGLTAVVGYDMIPRGYAAKPKNKKVYARQFAKLLMLTAAAPLLSAPVGLWRVLPAVIVLIGVFALAIWGGLKLTHFSDLTENERERDQR